VNEYDKVQNEKIRGKAENQQKLKSVQQRKKQQQQQQEKRLRQATIRRLLENNANIHFFGL